MDEDNETADELRDVLRRNGFVRCDIAACNCGGWHARYGLPERWDEVKDALAEAGHPLCNKNGNLVRYALKDLIEERDRLRAMMPREPVKARGLDQNGLYFLRVGEIADQAWFGNPRQQFNKDTWHIYLRMNVMAEEITTKDGEKRSKWEAIPGGGFAVISTTRLERKCFSEYIQAVEAFGASLGVRHSDNPNEGRR